MRMWILFKIDTGVVNTCVEMQVCMKLGWKSARTKWDILPLVLSANGHDPDYFDIPLELVMEVPLSHPT